MEAMQFPVLENTESPEMSERCRLTRRMRSVSERARTSVVSCTRLLNSAIVSSAPDIYTPSEALPWVTVCRVRATASSRIIWLVRAASPNITTRGPPPPAA